MQFDVKIDGVLETGGEHGRLVGLERGFVGRGEGRRCCNS